MYTSLFSKGGYSMTTVTTTLNGVEYVHTHVIVPRELKKFAKESGISMSKTLREALELKRRGYHAE
jgi:hypothetical protein